MNRTLPDTLYRAGQVQALDRRAIEDHGIAGYELMQRAGRAAFDCVRELSRARGTGDTPRLLAVCGGGNNGGDGYVIARLAAEAGCTVDVLSLVPEDKLKGDALTAARDWRRAGGRAVEPGTVDYAGYDVIVDALLGTGLQRPVEGAFARTVEAINQAGVPVLAVDSPSGLSADTGRPLGVAVRAAVTVTFVGMKQGLLTGEAPDYCGDIVFNDLSLPASVYEGTPPSARRLGATDLQRALPPRRRTAHKGDFGHVLVVGGDHGMAGAALMAGMAALRTGAGLVSIATRAEHVSGMVLRQPELMVHAAGEPADLEPLLAKAGVVAVGPGLGRSSWALGLLGRLLDSRLPLIVDADALNLLAADPCARGGWVLTPHPGEAARLLNTDTAAVQADRFAAAEALARQYAASVVLKGAGTLVAGAHGDTGDISLCDRGHPGMASGGMGDILTGMIAGVAAQCADLHQAARAGVWLHAAAGDEAAGGGERGIAATDLLAHLRGVLNGNV